MVDRLLTSNYKKESEMTKRNIWVLGGGTVSNVSPHFALSAPAYGTTARKVAKLFEEAIASNPEYQNKFEVKLGLTKMADPTGKDGIPLGATNGEVEFWIEEYILDREEPSVVFLNVAFCDWRAISIKGKDWGEVCHTRLKTSDHETKPLEISLVPENKVISRIRKSRKDIFLVGSSTTVGITPAWIRGERREIASSRYPMIEKGLSLLKKNSCNLVLANDINTRENMILTPEMAAYHDETYTRDYALKQMVDMTLSRCQGTFSRTEVIRDPIKNQLMDMTHTNVGTLFTVLQHCVSRGAYKPFNGVTVGHFAVKESVHDGYGFLWSSQRKKNFNHYEDQKLVRVAFTDDTQKAHGSKPSAGARSQYEVLKRFPDMDYVIHFHCPLRVSYDPRIPVAEQWPYECGSHECGKNTHSKMARIDLDGTEIAVVQLDRHGPNILFKRNADAGKVIDFIEKNFDLSKSTT